MKKTIAMTLALLTLAVGVRAQTGAVMVTNATLQLIPASSNFFLANSNLFNAAAAAARAAAGVVTNNQANVTLSGAFSGNGGGLTNLPVGVTNNQTGVTLSGTFIGNGNGLTNLPVNPADLTGTVVAPANGGLGNSNSDAGGLVNVQYKSEVGSSAFSRWSFAGNILANNQTNYDTQQLRCTTQLKRGGKVYVFYGVDSGSGDATKGFIAWASGSDFYSLVPGGLALTNSVTGFDSNHIGGPRFFTENGTNYMFYFGGTNVGFEGGPHSIGVAYQADTTNWNPGLSGWTKYSGNPILIPGTNNYDSGNCWRPFVIRNGSTYYLYYNGTGLGGKERINMATATNVLGPWSKYAGNPVVDDTSSTNIYTQDPSILRMSDGNFMMVYSLCCNGNEFVGTAWSHDLTNWIIGAHAPIDNYSGGQAQSFDLFMDGGAPCVMWDTGLNVYLAKPSMGISADKYNAFFRNLSATNAYVVNANVTNLVSSASSLGIAAASSMSVAQIGLTSFNLTNTYSPRLWLKADAVTNLNSGQNITNWNDSSSNALNTTSTGAGFPTWNLDATGTAYVQFNGNNNSLSTASTTLGTNVTILAVVSRNWPSAAYAPIISQSYGSVAGIGLTSTGGSTQDWTSNNLGMFGNGYVAGNAPRAIGPYGALANGQTVIISASLSATTSRVWLNGAAISTTEFPAAVTNNTAAIEIGSAVTAANFSDYKMRELLLFTSSVSDSDRQKLEAYLATRWGLLGSLPSTNSYKNFFGFFPIQGADISGNIPNASITTANVGTIILTNAPTLNKTNAAPANTNAAKLWFSATNNGSVYLIPGYQ